MGSRLLIVKGNLSVEPWKGTLQRASLPCVGAQHGGQARCGRDISVEGKLAVEESSA